jgi:hypothetical protein
MFCPGSGTERAQACVRCEGEMNKRKLGSFALGVMLIALGFPAEAQRPTKVPRIGYLSNTDNSGFFIKQKTNLTTLPGLRYSSGHRKGRLKILSILPAKGDS